MPTLILIFATMIWGCSYAFMKISINEITPLVFVFLRSLIASGLALPFLVYKKKMLTKTIFFIGLISGLCTMGMIFLQTKSVQTIPATTSAFIGGCTIIFVLIIKYIINRSKPSISDIITTSVCLCGLFLVTGNHLFAAGSGILYSVSGTVLAAVHLLILDKYAKDGTAIIITFLECIYCMLIGSFSLPDLICEFHNISKTVWTAIIISGVFCSFIAYALQAYAQKFLNAKRVALIFMLEPIFGAIFPHFYLHEDTINKSFIMGAFCILSSIAYLSLTTKNTH